MVPPSQYLKVVFPAGSTRESFDLHIIDDNKVEENETFCITIYDLSLPNGINLGSIANATVRVIDDDSKYNYVYTYNICIKISLHIRMSAYS